MDEQGAIQVENAPVLEGLKERLALAEEVGREAAALAFDYFERRESLLVETKRDMHDVVSIADREVETLIRQKMRAAFPDDGFLGEEFGLEAGSSSFTWVVDPIDGTNPFVNGMPNWCVSIGLIEGGKPALGVIVSPCLRETYVSARGLGATLNGRRLAIDPARTIRNGITGLGSNSHVTPDFAADMVRDLLTAGGSFFRNGSGALMLAYVAAGRLVGYYEPVMHAWDCMAAYSLITEAGGWHMPFPTEPERITRGALVIAAGPGAKDDLVRLAGAEAAVQTFG